MKEECVSFHRSEFRRVWLIFFFFFFFFCVSCRNWSVSILHPMNSIRHPFQFHSRKYPNQFGSESHLWRAPKRNHLLTNWLRSCPLMLRWWSETNGRVDARVKSCKTTTVIWSCRRICRTNGSTIFFYEIREFQCIFNPGFPTWNQRCLFPISSSTSRCGNWNSLLARSFPRHLYRPVRPPRNFILPSLYCLANLFNVSLYVRVHVYMISLNIIILMMTDLVNMSDVLINEWALMKITRRALYQTLVETWCSPLEMPFERNDWWKYHCLTNPITSSRFIVNKGQSFRDNWV